MAQILVIEDDELHRSLLVSVLFGAGHVVTEAADGQRGLEVAKLNIPDLVVTDLVMPEKEGIETIMEFRREFPEIGIIAMSGAGHASTYLQLASKLGAQATLAKPFPAEALLGAVEKTLNLSKRHSRPAADVLGQRSSEPKGHAEQNMSRCEAHRLFRMS